MSIFRRTVMCQQLTELITDYLEGTLPARTVRVIDRHLAGCIHCPEYLRQMERTIAILGELPGDAEIPDDLLDVLERALEDLGA